MKRARHHYVVLLFLGLLFAAPGIAAYFFYLHPSWLNSVTTNKGTLLTPPVLLTHSAGHSKWRLVLWSPNACEANCIEELDKLARIRLALGRHLYKVDSQLVIDAGAPLIPELLMNAMKEKDIQLIKLTQDEREKMPMLDDHLAIFIVNPNDYLVLAYQPTAKPGDIFHDLKQLVTK